MHYDEAFSSLQIPHFKGFARFHITRSGDLEMFGLALEKVGGARRVRCAPLGPLWVAGQRGREQEGRARQGAPQSSGAAWPGSTDSDCLCCLMRRRLPRAPVPKQPLTRPLHNAHRQVPHAWREDPRWRTPHGGGNREAPAHRAKFPSRQGGARRTAVCLACPGLVAAAARVGVL